MPAAGPLRLHEEAFVWDQHGCLPLRPADTVVDDITHYATGGVDYVSINVGCDFCPWTQTVAVLSTFRRAVAQRSDRFVLVSDLDDIVEAKRTGRIAVSFDIEGAAALNDDLSMIETYYALGVRTMLLVYNRLNTVGAGCHDDVDSGLSPFGRTVVEEMNRVGMVVDVSHCSYRTSMDAFQCSTRPVIFSHSNPYELQAHPRNITDEQIRACAATGGVIGVNGVNIFLPNGEASVEGLLAAVDYVVDLVGHEHVGLGLDFVFDRSELEEYVSANPETFPAKDGYGDGRQIEFLAPSALAEVAEGLYSRYEDDLVVRAILGENFLRIAATTWGGGDEDQRPSVKSDA